jgi:hypothetical protein
MQFVIWDLFEESKEESPSTRTGIRENSAGGNHFVAFAAQSTGVKDIVTDRATESWDGLGERMLPTYSASLWSKESQVLMESIK